MKLINKLITKTAIYKHLKDLYEQALKDVELIEVKINNTYEEMKVLKEDRKQTLKTLRKIRTHVNKLDKKDENVKAIKQLIKEVL